MASFTYNAFKTDLFDGSVDLDNDSFYCVLLSGSYSPDKSQHKVWADISASEVNQFAATGYTKKGEGLSGTSVTSAADEARWDANDVTWSSSTITAYYAAIYDASNSESLVCLIDFAADKSSSNGDFTIQWNAQGILNLNDA